MVLRIVNWKNFLSLMVVKEILMLEVSTGEFAATSCLSLSFRFKSCDELCYEVANFWCQAVGW